MKKVGVLLLAFLLLGCVHKLEIINFETGQVINGQYNEADRKVTVYMPDGQILTGKYSALSNATALFGTGFGFTGTTTTTTMGTGIAAGGKGQAYALLKSDTSNLMMEILVSYSEWSGHGFGEAITNDGRKFKVQF
jgi:hypothetical protein